MSFNIKEKISTYINDRMRELTEKQQTVLDYAQISRLFPEPNFIPFTSWSISPSVILHILNDIVLNKRQNIIEFGAGASTLYIAQLIKTLKLKSHVYSVEASQEWFCNMQKEILRCDLGDIVTLILAPMTVVPEDICLREQKLWYDSGKITDALQEAQEFDLVIVDGPYGSSTPFARYSAIPFLQGRLSKEYGVFLDDAQRKEEQEIAEVWTERLNIKPQYIKRYAYFKSNESFETIPYMI